LKNHYYLYCADIAFYIIKNLSSSADGNLFLTAPDESKMPTDSLSGNSPPEDPAML
jgi:hypothetical protein